MRRIGFLLILAGLSLNTIGCKPDRATQQSSTIDARPTDLPRQETAYPSVASASPASDSDAAKDPRPRIVAFGDSLTAGYGTEAGQSYPEFLQQDLDRLGYHYRVINAGISGNTTKDGVERIPSIIAMKPAVVIVEFGGNDGLRGLRIEDSRANLDKIVSTLQASGTKVVLAGISLPPDYGPDYIRQFNETYTLLAKKYHVPLLPFLLKDVYGVDGMMQHDRTHATAQGNQVVAQNVLPLITPLLKK
ncbi:acyl-CoA thioesterase-1 [Edaphobacter aggregans]|uniref:Acyl-CoA thioesterase-1 n=1 Tax=Edaphobacter aggregans TaxID=570835 RepID=A0A428ME69_9BACT|nr:arylesterase [Edaphobacter aggregans]RSL15175.1 acyl-CoA thioesterase-1 [Edaphobacter aggregans]